MSRPRRGGPLLLAVDGGSQSTKLSLVDATGRVHASARVALRAYGLGPGGRVVHPDDDLWDGLVAACARLWSAYDGVPADVVAVGLCGIRSCRALLDADGRLVEPVLSWMDERVPRPVRDLAPEVATVTSAGGYLTTRLTGERRDSAASYRGMWPLDPSGRRWSDDPAEHRRTGLAPDLLPGLVEPGEVLGTVTPAAAAATGLPAGVPVVSTANDKAVEALGAGLLPPPHGGCSATLLSLGTYVAAMVATPDDGRPVQVDDGRRWVNAAAAHGTALHESVGVRRGMWTVTWWRRLLAGASGDAVGESALVDRLETGAAGVPPGSEGLVALPDWLAPPEAPHRSGALLGLGAEHGPFHVHRSILEGVVLTMRSHVRALEDSLTEWCGGPSTGAPDRTAPVVVTGGGAGSDLVMQMVADAFARPVVRPAVADAVGTGAAICAALAAGLHPDVATAVRAMVHPGDRFEPGPAAVASYAELGDLHADLRALTDAAFLRLARPGP